MITFYRVLQGIPLLAGFLAIIVLGALADAAGNSVLGLTMIVTAAALMAVMGFVGWLVNSRHRRAIMRHHRAVALGGSVPRRTVQAQESETYQCDVETVWSLIRPAEAAVLLSDAKRAFTVPGTPTGVGEQQCFIRRDGSVSIIEVVEEERPRWAATRIITPSNVDTRQTYRLEPSGTGCTFTMGISLEIPATVEWPRDHQREWREQTRQYLVRVKQILGHAA